MNSSFFRYPHTPHLAWLSDGSPREDKVLTGSEVSELLSGSVVVEEKLDGANLGFSKGRNGRLQVQNRGGYLESPYSSQFVKLNEWLEWRGEEIREALGDDLIFFGEWCAARHTVPYTALPDWWLLFDVYDKRAGKFWSVQRRNFLAKKLRIEVVPSLFVGNISLSRLQSCLEESESRFGATHLEGLIIRKESVDWLLKRAKLVRSDFVQAIGTHWRSRSIQWNRLGY